MRYNQLDGKEIYKKISQPVTFSLENGLYKILIESGADVNSFVFSQPDYGYYYYGYNYTTTTIRDEIEKLIEKAQKQLSDYKLKLYFKLNKGTKVVNNKDIINRYLKDLLVQERDKVSSNSYSYRSHLLKMLTVDELYKF